jgi:rubrerythrin
MNCSFCGDYTNLLGKRGTSKDIVDFIHCLSFLENKTSALYEKLSEKTVSPTYCVSFLKISQNAKRHSEDLDKIAAQIGRSKVNKRECAKRLTTICKSIETVSKKIEKKNLLSLEELFDIIFVLEGSLGEENFMLIQLKTLVAMAPQIRRLYGVHLESFRNLLYAIATDEETHIEMLEHIKAAIDKKLCKKEGRAPSVKYKNPDSWAVSAPYQP